MPSVRRLFPAVILAAAAWLAAQIYFTYLPENSVIGKFREICAGIGLIIGWTVVGKRIGEGYRRSVEAGLLGSFLIVLWSVAGFSMDEMLSRALDRRYKQGLGDAFADLVDIIFEYGYSVFKPDVIGALVLGGILAGIVAQWAAARWQ